MSEQSRTQQLRAWFRDWSGDPDAELAVVSGDASFRRYFRGRVDTASVIVVDAPPDKEKNPEFIAISRALAAAGIRCPRVIDADLARGFLVIEDLGDQLLLPLLDDATADGFYGRATAMLRRLALAPVGDFDLPAYDLPRLANEMALFPEWFCGGLLGLDANSESRRVYTELRDTLCARALQQARVFVHRDFHSRNLMVLDDGQLAAIDFQDAVIGPLTYDLVSLLKDCYLRWPDERIRHWALAHREALASAGFEVPDEEAFLVDLDWMGLQRHIKVLGIFARLWLRDGKSAYLDDLPRVIGYVRDTLRGYPDEPALASFLEWFDTRVMPVAEAQEWFREAESQ